LIKFGSKFEQIWSILAICEVQTESLTKKFALPNVISGAAKNAT
jgi:hypothetical protein